jgi:hypothetical protein
MGFPPKIAVNRVICVFPYLITSIFGGVKGAVQWLTRLTCTDRPRGAERDFRDLPPPLAAFAFLRGTNYPLPLACVSARSAKRRYLYAPILRHLFFIKSFVTYGPNSTNREIAPSTA